MRLWVETFGEPGAVEEEIAEHGSNIEEDRLLNENTADGEDIGTTLRGIGPCYRDKVGRSYAIRLGDLCRVELRHKIGLIIDAKKRALAGTAQPPVTL